MKLMPGMHNGTLGLRTYHSNLCQLSGKGNFVTFFKLCFGETYELFMKNRSAYSFHNKFQLEVLFAGT